MASVMNKAFLFSCLLVVTFSVPISGDGECLELRCKSGEPAVRFPFRLKGHHPDSCGYAGFDMSCSDNGRTIIELPTSGPKFFVKSINYKSQSIHVYDPENCLPAKIQKIDLSSTPFQLNYSALTNVSFFKCPSTAKKLQRRDLDFKMPCLESPGYDAFAHQSGAALEVSPGLLLCTKMYSIWSVPYQILEYKHDLHMNWSRPDCRGCEAEGKECRFKSNSAKQVIECIKIQKSKGHLGRLAVSGIVVGSFFLSTLAVIAIYILHKSKKVEENQIRIKKFLEDYKALKPTRYTYADIKRITSKFQENIGQGAFGVVFKGKLSEEVLVAVKVLNSSTRDGEEFVNEVKTIGRIHHVNIVRLVGYCADGFRRALVYEYISNGSLQNMINSAEIRGHTLGWDKLLEIAMGIAKGVEYLHQGCDLQILHFDIKPHNILLDNNFSPKICDFGAAKLFSKDKSKVTMTAARGTLGYIAPEVMSRNFGNVSSKSDVYSYGILLLEMAGAKMSINSTRENDQIYIAEQICGFLEHGEALQIHVEKEKDAKIVKKLATVGLWCIQWHPVDRPSMRNVVQMLEGEDSLSVPPNPFTSIDPSKRNDVFLGIN